MNIVKLTTGNTPHFNIQEKKKTSLGDNEVLVRIRACALNYRDLIVADGNYPGIPSGGSIIPLSDGCGDIVDVGKNVTTWSIGTRVISSFFQDWRDGSFLGEYMQGALGGGIDGVLCEYRIFPEHSVVRAPENLSYEEAASLPCAALTAWHALFEKGETKPGDRILTLGSGGVSVFAIQFAKLSGAVVFATSSNDSKLDRLKALGADHGVNYLTHKNWDEEIKTLTLGEGVNHVIEVGGGGTLTTSMNALSHGGTVSLIGRLTGTENKIDPRPIVAKGLTVNGIYVGSVSMLQRMCRTIETKDVKPIIDRSFDYRDVAEAYDYLRSGTHFGKVVITV